MKKLWFFLPLLILALLFSLASCAEKHDFGKWIDDVPATCAQPGVKGHYHCSHCNKDFDVEKKVELSAEDLTIPATGLHTEVIDAAVAPTCTTAGKTAGKHCSVCNTVLEEQQTVAATGHTEVIDAAVAPTCTTAGLTEGKHCSVCNTVLEEQQTVAATGHTEVIDNAVAPTCTTAGKTAGKHCSVCNTVLIAQQEVVATGVHTFGDWTIDTAADFDNKGSRSRTCSACNATETEVIPEVEVAYRITLDYGSAGTEVVRVDQSGAYTLPTAKEKIGFTFFDWVDKDKQTFPASGTVTADITVYASYVVQETKTFAQLKERVEAGAEVILLADNITLTDTVYVSSDVLILTVTGKNYTLTRASSFPGDLFVIGSTASGEKKTAKLTIQPAENTTITVDGNKDNMETTVAGTAFFVEATGDLTLDGVEIVNCEKTANGRLLSGGYDMNDPDLSGGAAIMIVGGKATLSNCAVRNCAANTNDYETDDQKTDEAYRSARGGAIYAYHDSGITLNNVTIENCSAARGGAIAVFGSKETVSVSGNTAFTGNTASRGGAIYNSGSAVMIGDTEGTVTFSKNAAQKDGGAIGLYSKGALTVTGAVDFEENTSGENGGAIYAPSESLALIGGTSTINFTQNKAENSGGAIYNSGATVIIGTTGGGTLAFAKNTAAKNGGAIAVYKKGTLTLTDNVAFTENIAQNNGGAVYMYDESNATLLAFSEGAQMLFKENQAQNAEYGGGAIYNSGSSLSLTASGSASITFEKNESSKNGGAIAVYSSGTLTTSGNILFTENKAKTNGGAIYLNTAVATCQTLTATGNSSKGGAAIYVTKTTLSAGTITANQNAASGNGGAIYIYSSAKVSIGTLNATENTANENGGVLYISKDGDDSDATPPEVTITTLNASDNTAQGTGGGVIYATGASVTTITSIAASGNTAKKGGCIYITTTDTTLKLLGGDITGNTATTSSGGNAIWSNTKKVILQIKGGTSQEYLKYGADDFHSKNEETTIQDITE